MPERTARHTVQGMGGVKRVEPGLSGLGSHTRRRERKSPKARAKQTQESPPRIHILCRADSTSSRDQLPRLGSWLICWCHHSQAQVHPLSSSHITAFLLSNSLPFHPLPQHPFALIHLKTAAVCLISAHPAQTTVETLLVRVLTRSHIRPGLARRHAGPSVHATLPRPISNTKGGPCCSRPWHLNLRLRRRRRIASRSQTTSTPKAKTTQTPRL